MMIVFDLNGTLLYRVKKSDKENIKRLSIIKDPDYKLPEHYVYLRPNLQILSDFLDKHNLSYIFWSTCSDRNTKNLCDTLVSTFKNCKGYLSQEECETGENRGNAKAPKWVKNLNRVSKIWNKIYKEAFDVNNVVLVDDSDVKSVKGQNFILASPFEGDMNDNGILDICKKIHLLLKCENIHCINN